MFGFYILCFIFDDLTWIFFPFKNKINKISLFFTNPNQTLYGLDLDRDENPNLDSQSKFFKNKNYKLIWKILYKVTSGGKLNKTIRLSLT